MSFNGFSSVSAYEAECRRLGFTTERIPYRRGDQECFLLITSPPKTPTSVSAWHLFTADEKEILSGIISGGTMDPAKYLHNGVDVNYTGKLAAHGYYPAIPDSSPAKAAPATKIIPFPVQVPLDDPQPGSQISLF